MFPGKSPFPMLPVDECVAIVARHQVAPCEAELVPLDLAFGRVLAENVSAPEPVPRFRASIMDGFAVRSAEGSGVFPLDVVTGVTAGSASSGPLREGHVRYITTGAAVPDGADAVVQVESTQEVWKEGALHISIGVTSRPGANIRQIGSDTKQGEVVLAKGAKVGAGEIGILATMGFANVKVFRKPKVAVLSTGDEVLDVSAGSGPDSSRGQIIDSNRPMLKALVLEAGGEPLDCGIVQDNLDDLRQRLRDACAAADVVVTSGGVSRGSKDYQKQVLAELGQLHFGEMCMKPGKPSTFATVQMDRDGQTRRVLVFGLPGNPVSCFVTFKLLVHPALARLQGHPAEEPLFPRVEAELAQDVEMDPVRPEYHRARARWLNGRIVADSTGFQRSSRIASVAEANCFLEIPSRSGALRKGTVVKALLLPGRTLLPAPEGFPSAAPKANEEKPQSQEKRSREGVARRLMVLTVGEVSPQALLEVEAVLQAAGDRAKEELLLTHLRVAAEAEALRGKLREVASSQVCDMVLVLGSFSLDSGGSLVADAVAAELERSAPGVADLVLRAALQHSSLSMLEQLRAGTRCGALVVSLPALAPGSAGCLVPLLPHLGRL